MEFKRFAGVLSAVFLTSYAPVPETHVNAADSVSASSAAAENETELLDPLPSERGRYSCKSRSMHGGQFYFAIPNQSNVPIDCEAGTTFLISRNLGDTSPPPAGR